jgi:hypothetical protein
MQCAGVSDDGKPNEGCHPTTPSLCHTFVETVPVCAHPTASQAMLHLQLPSSLFRTHQYHLLSGAVASMRDSNAKIAIP